MSSPSNLLNSLTYAERKSLAGLVAVALPADDLASGEWNKTLLEDVLTFLDLDTTLAEGFYPMTERGRWEMSLPATGLSAVESWEQRVEAFRACLPPAGEERLVALRDLMVIVALHCGYDARTRVTFRRVCDAMQVPWHPRVSEVESTLARKVYERVSQDRERELKEDRWRGLKIGAAMIGGGALLAVSGGLAAPAVAAGIAASSSLIGATAAATLSGFATTAWMATLFGATGAGLVGYKMDRRTKGVQEFEFESETSAGEEMCVSICVPGLLRDSSDLQRGWGVEPRGPDVTAQERLRRYYYVYNREKVENVDEILKAYKGQEISLCRRLAAKYGADPRDPPTREALAKAEGRELEPLSEEELAIDADAIGCLMETVLSDEKRAKAVSKAADKFSSAVKKRRGGSQADGQEEDDRLMENDHHAPETSNDTSPTSTISWIDHAKVRPKRGASRASAASSRNFLGESPGEVGGRDVDWHGSAPVGFDVVRSRPPGASGKPPDGDYGRASIEGGSTESKRRETTNVSSAVVEGTAIDPNETPVMVGNPGVEGETAMMSTGTGSSPGLETAIAVPWAVVVSSEPPAQGVLLRDWGTSADNSNAKNPPGKVIAKDGSAVDGGASSGALGNVGSRVIGRLRDETLADALNGATMDRPLAWAEAALKRCDGDESRAVALIESTTAKEMDALVEQDAEEERAKGEEEQREMHRVWFWQDMMPHTDQYILRWETKQLLDVGQSVETVVSTLSQSAMEQTLKYTTLATLMAALTWPLALITLANMIDTDWTIGRERADIAGKILADALLNREQGCRPVTLIGTSLGARLIFACLEEITRRHELWEEEVAAGLHAGSEAVGGNPGSQSGSQRRRRRFGRGGRGGGDDGEDGFGADKTKRKPSTRDPKGEARSAAGVIENVAILGAPIGASPARWQRISRIVHGRLINGYSKSDMILGLVFRAKSLSFSIAGVQKVVAPGVENLDLSSIIGTNHFHYNRRMPEVLAALALDDCSRYICRGDDDAVDASAAGPGSGGKDPAGAFESVENFY